ncbi:MAG: hypothetical protein K2K01_01350, partial [Eubacterium sp.]|nr:hypothetical protein [Eubacterium sp.]
LCITDRVTNYVVHSNKKPSIVGIVTFWLTALKTFAQDSFNFFVLQLNFMVYPPFFMKNKNFLNE